MGLLPRPNVPAAAFLLLVFAAGVPISHPAAFLWTAPAILISSMMIAWAAESAQFFIAQGFALAILAWLQTLPEFAVEAVLAWHQEVDLLLANLTGALRLLTGFGWPVIYLTAATVHRRRSRRPLRKIRLHEHHAVEVMGLALPLLYIAVILLKGSLTVYDSIVLIALYGAYLAVLGRMPPEDAETVEELEAIPRKIVTSPRRRRIAIIAALFGAGGLLIYFSAEPFLASLLALAIAAGVPAFVFVQWIAPLVSEFPEMASTFYWARTVDRAPVALMNMVSSNINQWTLLAALLPVILSISAGHSIPIVFDRRQHVELLLTLAQAAAGVSCFLGMELRFWQASALAVLFLIPFFYAPSTFPIVIIYFAWAGAQVIWLALRRGGPPAFAEFGQVWRSLIWR
jgi:cation:H+ antiporter